MHCNRSKTEEMVKKYSPEKIIDAQNKIVLPGLIDSHVHLANEGPKGFIPDNIPAIPWITDWVHPMTRIMTPEDEYYLALSTIIEMLKTGTTTFFEAGTLKFAESAAEAIEQTGIRGVIGRRTLDVAFSKDSLAGKIEDALTGNRRMIERFHGKANGRIQTWVSLVGVGSASDKLLVEAKRLADCMGLGLNMHQSQAPEEVDKYTQRVGKRPIEHFEDLGILGKNLRLVHMIDVQQKEIELLKKYDVKVIHCPTTALKLGYGATRIGKFPEMIKEGLCISLGCDGPNCSNHFDMGVAMYLAAGIYKDSRMDVNLVPAEMAIEMATINGARSMLMDNQIGSIEKGKKADLILLNAKYAGWVPLINVVNQIVYAAGLKNVDTSIIDGEIVMENGTVKTIDELQLFKKIEKISEDIIKRSGLPLVRRWKHV
jgi:5-methylthioadenosine/S-adenosylhomocysteine deaminase